MVKVAHAFPAPLVEPAAPPWAQRFALRLEQHFKPLFPAEPINVWAVTKAELPPPADWRGCMVIVSDQACLAVSDGASWQKIAFGGPV
jgi:hypothetical protein